MSIYDKYEVIIGLEVHVQLLTASKLFAPDSAAFGAKPNENTSFITLGHPGTLPCLNEKAVEYAVKMGLALNCPIRAYNYFDRKNYFYPDLPKGYQISQDKKPICGAGFLEIEVGEETKKIRIHHIHMEEDAGKSLHDQSEKYSMIDLNRAGVPLLEIVTEPDMRSAEEASIFLNSIRQLIQYLEVSDGNMEEGSLRCDCNISVRLKGTEPFNNRAEIKNMNSVRFVRKAVEYEFKRQIDLLESGGEMKQETRGFDANRGVTLPQREKEMAHDYRYFPEPDLAPLHLSKAYLEEIRQAMPALPHELRQKFTKEYALSAYDAGILTETKEMAAYFETVVAHCPHAKMVANFMINTVKAYLNDQNISIQEAHIPPQKLAKLIDLVVNDKVNRQAAQKKLFPQFAKDPQQDPEKLAQTLGLVMEKDDNFVLEIIEKVLNQHPDKVKAYKSGKKNLFGMFMGQIMRASGGKIDPKAGKKLLEEKLKE